MNSWDTDLPGRVARANATRAFCEYMDKSAQPNADDRRLCAAVPPSPAGLQRARALWKQLGDFWLEEDGPPPAGIKAIPGATVIRVYEPDNRDDLVTIVLPERGDLPPASLFTARDYYRCTYWPYKPNESGAEKNR